MSTIGSLAVGGWGPDGGGESQLVQTMLWVCLVWGGGPGESGSDQGFSCRIGLNGGNCPALVGVETCNTLRGAFLGSLKSSGVLVLASGRRMREVWTGPER